jgi:hypothetical protein
LQLRAHFKIFEIASFAFPKYSCSNYITCSTNTSPNQPF